MSAMPNTDDGRTKAMKAVTAMFDRYKLLAAQRPENHIVRLIIFPRYIGGMLTYWYDAGLRPRGNG